MGFRLVPKYVTLNDRERRCGHYFVLFRGISVGFMASFVQVVD